MIKCGAPVERRLPPAGRRQHSYFAVGKMQTNLLLRCPAAASPGKAGSRLADRCHSLPSLTPPPAAVGSLPQTIRA